MNAWARRPTIGFLKLAAVLAFLAACGGGAGDSATLSPSPHPSPTSAASPSPTPPSLSDRRLAFLLSNSDRQTSTVEWVTPTGDVEAKATFPTPELSAWTNAAPLLQPYAHVVDGSIFYVDAQGRIATLASDGSTKIVSNLLLRSGQNIVSFAVSPDAQSIAASILNYPPRHNPPPNSLSDPFLQPGGWWYDYETAVVGQPAHRVVSRDLGSFPNAAEPADITTVIGWDQGGPVAISDTQLAFQSPIISTLTAGKALVHLGPDGSHHDQLGSSSCAPLDWSPAGNVVCYTVVNTLPSGDCVAHFAVKPATGMALWAASSECNYGFNPRLSPASDRFCTDRGTVYNQSGSTNQLPKSAPTGADACLGWLDDSTVVLFAGMAQIPQVYTLDLASQARNVVMTARFGVVQYLGSVAGNS
jgi:hypothetical protein